MIKYNKCKFCEYNDEYEGCENICNDYSEFSVSLEKVIDKAEELGISVSDLITLINLND